MGTKLDKRQDEELALESNAKVATLVSTAEGMRMQEKIGAVKYLECSALMQVGVGAVFAEAVQAAMDNFRTRK